VFFRDLKPSSAFFKKGMIPSFSVTKKHVKSMILWIHYVEKGMRIFPEKKVTPSFNIRYNGIYPFKKTIEYA
jgi:hypothetical protein